MCVFSLLISLGTRIVEFMSMMESKLQPSSSLLSLNSTTSGSSSSHSSLRSIASRTVKHITQSVKKAANKGAKTAARPFKKIRASLSSGAGLVNNQGMCSYLLAALHTKLCEYLGGSALKDVPRAPTPDDGANTTEPEKEEDDDDEIGAFSPRLVSSCSFNIVSFQNVFKSVGVPLFMVSSRPR